MSQSLFIAFVVFAIVMFFTPGPNNIMLLSSALTYGFRRTVPHLLGIVIGFAFMVGGASRRLLRTGNETSCRQRIRPCEFTMIATPT